jgi:hypothetical protein
VAGAVAVPLNVATKDDIEQLRAEIRRIESATKEDLEKLRSEIKRIEDKMATKEDIKRLESVMATKEDLKQYATKQDLEAAVEQLKKWAEERFATKEDVKRIENKVAAKEQFEALAVSVEESGRDMIQYLLERRGYRCVAERLRVDAEYELDIYCNAGAITAVGEAKVRAGWRDVEKAVERVRELQRTRPDKISGRPVPVLYTPVAEPPAVQRARELGIWLIESRREVVALEEVLGAGRH